MTSTAKSKVDLHIHSTASDGRLSPEDVVRRAAASGLKVIALADHDTVDGIPAALEAAKEFPWLIIIPCVEINTDVANGEAHLLGYFVDHNNTELQNTLANLRNSRVERADKIVAKLRKLNIYIDMARVRELAGKGSIGRPHIAQAMLEKGYISSIREAFNKYIGHNGPAYVERAKITPQDAVKLVLRADGFPVLAHPLTIENPEAMVADLKQVGLVGLEAYYGDYTIDDVDKLVRLAGKYDLITTGGSDFHGFGESNEVPMGGVAVPMEAADRLIALAT